MDKRPAFKNKEVVQSILKKVIDGDVGTVKYGLCFVMSNHLIDNKFLKWEALYTTTRLIEYACKDWPQFSGNVKYPVPNGKDPYIGYREGMACNTLWVGEQRELRIDLAKHLLSKVDGFFTAVTTFSQ